METLNLLSRNEMRNIKGGRIQMGPCSDTLTCPSGWTITCGSNESCYVENDGDYEGYINCGTGSFQFGCWMHEPRL